MVFILPLLLDIKFFYLAVTKEKSLDFHLLMGDFGYFIGLKFHLNILGIILMSMGAVTQMINFYDFR